MKKFTAFTLAEILIALSVVGIIAVSMITILDKSSMDEDINTAKAYQAFEAVQQGSAKILSTETIYNADEGTAYCPEGKFLTKVLASNTATATDRYTYEYAIVKGADASTAATKADVLELYKKYIRFDDRKADLNFCTYSNYCDSTNTNITGGKLAGTTYIGFEVFGDTALQDCPNTYYLPQSGELITKTEGTTGKCWGKVYVDVDGKKGEGALGKDVFIWGLGESGIAY